MEIYTIKTLLHTMGIPYSQTAKGWGADVREFEQEIKAKTAEGYIPVTVELGGNIGDVDNLVTVDHHNEKSDRPASVVQVCLLLNIPITREIELIAANDSGWIPQMQAIGATEEEIRAIRRQDRSIQGVTEEIENQSAAVIKKVERFNNLRLSCALGLPFNRFAAIKDELFTQGYQNILLRAQNGEMEFQGDGKICAELHAKYEGSRSGGVGLGKQGGKAYWGGYPEDWQEVTEHVKQALRETL